MSSKDEELSRKLAARGCHTGRGYRTSNAAQLEMLEKISGLYHR